jgi:hypothetical protein
MTIIYTKQNKFVKILNEIMQYLETNTPSTYQITDYIDGTHSKYNIATLEIIYNNHLHKILILPKKAYTKFNVIGIHIFCNTLEDARKEYPSILNRLNVSVSNSTYCGYILYI